jgi:hypothetical protein
MRRSRRRLQSAADALRRIPPGQKALTACPHDGDANVRFEHAMRGRRSHKGAQHALRHPPLGMLPAS